jgi:hypothetical protein
MFMRLVDAAEKRGLHARFEWRSADKGIYLTEVPKQQHELPLGYITLKALGRYEARHAEAAGLPEYDAMFELLGTTSEQLAGRYKGPDQAMRLKARPLGSNPRRSTGGWPSFVVEMGWAETLAELDDDAQLWLGSGTDVQVGC